MVQAGLGGDVARREARFPGALEALAPCGACLVTLLLRSLESCVQALHLGSGFLPGGTHGGGSLWAGSVLVADVRQAVNCA